MQQPDWIQSLIERADIGITARMLAPVAPTESVIGRLPRRFRQLYAAYTLQVSRVKRALIATDQNRDYTREPLSGDMLDNPAVVLERNKMLLMHWVFWLTLQNELQLPGKIGIRQYWQIVRI
ncbi:MAG: hypothetical protein HZC01_04075 [Candidatus Kerfeldbacteria bacterium]|nr:hypothetical protein [Candidatus Kerfeldbacteria bacterium]